MNKLIEVGIVLLFLVSSIPILATPNHPVSQTIYVDDSNIEGPWDGTLEHPYRSIQDGVEASHDGDTVFVFNGFYHETTVNRTINLLGESKEQTIIINEDNIYIYACITLESNMTNMSGFTIRSEGQTVKYENSLDLSGSFCNISNNIFSTETWAIIAYGHNNVLSHNYFSNCSEGGIKSWGFNHIVKNTIVNNGLGISIGGGDTIELNYLKNNDKGMGTYDFIGTALVTVMKNQFEANHIGIEYQNVGRAAISNNNFMNNTRSAFFYYPNVFASTKVNWNLNYWSKHASNRPKIIPGRFLLWGEILPYEIGIYLPWVAFDWQPATKPYDIPTMN
jgi:hypothetical protein